MKIHEDSVGPFRDSCALCPVLCSSGSWYGEKEIQIRTNISHLSMYFVVWIMHVHECIRNIKFWDATALFLSKSRAQVPRSFPNRKPNCLLSVPSFSCVPSSCKRTYTFLLFTFVSSPVILFFSSFPYLYDSVQPLFFVPEIDQATEVYVKDAAKD